MRKHSSCQLFKVVGLAVLLLTGTCPRAMADVEIEKLSDVFDKFLVGGEVHTFYRGDSNPYFGADVPNTSQQDVRWGELFTRLRLTGVKDVGWARLEGQMAFVGLATVDQDLYGAVSDESDVEINQANIKLAQLWKGPLDLTIGMQDLRIEKQLLIGIGRSQDAALWLPFHDSWPFAVQLDGDFDNFQAKAFWARAEDYLQTFELKDDVEAAGINLHYNFSEQNYVYGGYFAKIDDSGDDGFVEQNTQNLDFGFDFTFGRFNLEGEGVYQSGDVTLPDGTELDRNAVGGFISPKYSFPGKRAPYIKLHYIHFPGDDDPSDDELTEWDPMFWGFPGWNKWVIGELVGEAQLINTNKTNTIIEVGFSPVENMTLSAMYIRHQLNEKYFPAGPANPVPVSSRDYADEYNLFMDWAVTDNLFIHVGAGYVSPDKAAKEVFGSDEDAVFGHVWLWYSF